MTISGLRCDGKYRVECWSTYDNYDIDSDGAGEGGGRIRGWDETVSANAGQITINIPDLVPLGNAPYAQDYGFKLYYLDTNGNNKEIGHMITPR